MFSLGLMLLGATVFGDGSEPLALNVSFSANLVSTVSVEWEEYWRGDDGLAVGHYQDPDRRVSFVLPLTLGEVVVLSPDMPSGVREGVVYVSLDDVATEVVAWQ